MKKIFYKKILLVIFQFVAILNLNAQSGQDPLQNGDFGDQLNGWTFSPNNSYINIYTPPQSTDNSLSINNYPNTNVIAKVGRLFSCGNPDSNECWIKFDVEIFNPRASDFRAYVAFGTHPNSVSKQITGSTTYVMKTSTCGNNKLIEFWAIGNGSLTIDNVESLCHPQNTVLPVGWIGPDIEDLTAIENPLYEDCNSNSSEDIVEVYNNSNIDINNDLVIDSCQVHNVPTLSQWSLILLTLLLLIISVIGIRSKSSETQPAYNKR